MIYIHLYCNLRNRLPEHKDYVCLDSVEMITLEEIYTILDINPNILHSVICQGRQLVEIKSIINRGEHVHMIPLIDDG